MKRKNLIQRFNPATLKTIESIEVLKRDFLLKDIKYKAVLENDENPVVDLAATIIQAEVVVGKSIVKTVDEMGFEDDEVQLNYDFIEVDFYEEFERAMGDHFIEYCNKFELGFEKKGVFSSEDLEGYKGMKLKKINELVEYVRTKSPIENKIKKLLEEFYNNLYDYISNFRFEDSQVNKKLKFNLNKNQLIWFFLSLYENGLIKGMSYLDLYAFIERNTMYFDSEKGEYIDMDKVRTQGNKFTKNHISPTESVKVLEQVFHTTFFSNKYK